MKIFNEPTYSLKLTDQNSPLPTRVGTPYPDLDTLIDQVAKDQLLTREQVARSLMNKSDQRSCLKINLKLAKNQGLLKIITKRLDNDKELAEFVFSDCSEENFGFILGIKCRGNSKLFKEVCKIRDELHALTSGTIKHYRPPQLTNGLSYTNHDGKKVVLSHTNGFMNLSSEGHVIYSSGEMRTKNQAHDLLYRMISQTINSGQIEEAGNFSYPVLIEDLDHNVPTSLTNKAETISLPNGQKAALKLIHCSSNLDGSKPLEEYYLLQKEKLSPSKQKAVEYSLKALKNSSTLRDKLVLRSFICEVLNIPYHVASSDQAPAALAIKKGVHLFHNIEIWKGSAEFRDPRGLFDNPIFREYTEAALFELLPLTDHSSFVLDGKLYTPSGGFVHSPYSLEEPLLASVLTKRHIYVKSIVEQAWKGVFGGAVTFALSPLFASVSIVVLGVLCYKHGKEEGWNKFRHRFLPLFLLPMQLGFRKEWVNQSDKALKERGFFFHQKPTKTAPALQKFYDQVDNLKSYNHLLQFIQNGQTEITDEDKAVLTAVADNWTTLQKVTSLPRRIQKLLKASESSPLLLFHLLRHFNQSFVEKAVHENEALLLWPAENSYHALVKSPSKEKLTTNLASDIGRQKYMIQGKHRSHSFMNLHPNKWDEMQKVLLEFSLFRDDVTIPSQVQESLTQNIFAPLEMIFTSICSDVCHKNVEKAIVIEEGDDSHFWITIRNKATIRALLEDDSVSFDFNYRLKISKSATGEWSTQFISITPFQTKVDGALKGLLETAEVSDVLEETSRVAREGVNDIVRSERKSLQQEGAYTSSHLEKLIRQHEGNVVRTI